MGAELAPASSTGPREDDRAGEACALQSPPFAGRGAAPNGTLGVPFSSFAAGVSLAKRYGHQASATKQGIKQESSTYWLPLASSSNLRPYLKPESQLLGSASRGSEAGGASAGRLGAGADPRGTSPVLSFFEIGGKLSPPRSSPSSSSLSKRRRARDLHRRRGALDSPSVASESGPPSRSSSSSYSLESPEDTFTVARAAGSSGTSVGTGPSPLKTGMESTTLSQSSRRNKATQGCTPTCASQ